MPDVSEQQGIITPLQPMSYATALKWLRHCINAPWKQRPSSILDASVFTIHSSKAFLLSWSAQQAHLLTEEDNHRISAKGLLRLYSREDVYPALHLQGILREAILQGWRPSVPQHRGSQSALMEPNVDNIEQYSRLALWIFIGSALGNHSHWRLSRTLSPLKVKRYRNLFIFIFIFIFIGGVGYFPRRHQGFSCSYEATSPCYLFPGLVRSRPFLRWSCYDSGWFWQSIYSAFGRYSIENSLWTQAFFDYADSWNFSVIISDMYLFLVYAVFNLGFTDDAFLTTIYLFASGNHT